MYQLFLLSAQSIESQIFGVREPIPFGEKEFFTVLAVFAFLAVFSVVYTLCDERLGVKELVPFIQQKEYILNKLYEQSEITTTFETPGTIEALLSVVCELSIYIRRNRHKRGLTNFFLKSTNEAFTELFELEETILYWNRAIENRNSYTCEPRTEIYLCIRDFIIRNRKKIRDIRGECSVTKFRRGNKVA